MKILSLVLLLLIPLSVTAEDYTVISISGFLESWKKTDPYEQKYSGVHHEYEADLEVLIDRRFRFNHGVSKKKLQSALTQTGCESKLIVVANSWGSYKAIKLSEMYEENCKKPLDLFVMIDGVAKPVGPQKSTPKSKKCINYYQQKSLVIHGSTIEGCENREMSSECTSENKDSETCHMYVCRMGAKASEKDIHNYIWTSLGNN